MIAPNENQLAVGLAGTLGLRIRNSSSSPARSGGTLRPGPPGIGGSGASTPPQLDSGLQLTAHSHDDGDVSTIAVLVVICFLIGIYRSWDLIGGPSFGVRREVSEILHHQMTDVGAGPEQREGNADDA
jgi:hypothetical protein